MKVLFLFLLFKLIKGIEHEQSQNGAETDHVVQKWLHMDAALKNASQNFVKSLLPSMFELVASSGISSNCTNALVTFIRGIGETKHWAFRMLDSSGKLPSGIMGGTLVSLGDYDTCLEVDVVNSFQGKYCLVDFETPLPKRQRFRPDEEQIPGLINISGNDTIIGEISKLGRRLYISEFRTSVCVPSTCTRDDVQSILSKVSTFSGLAFDLNVKSCEAKNDVMIVTSVDKVLMLILGSLFFLVIIGTIMDVLPRIMAQNLEGEEYKSSSFFLYFSLYTNGMNLFKKDDNPESIRVFHGIKTITMLWIILSHTYAIRNYKAYDGLYVNKNLHQDFWFQFIANAYLSVDTFFFMCAVLLAYNVTKFKEKKLTVTLVFILRYIRITIPHLLMIACVCLLPYLSSGPLYKEIVGQEAQKCHEFAWQNVLYIQNFFPFQNTCVRDTWFLAADTQLFLLSSLILIPFKNNPKVKFVLIGVSLAFGLAGTMISYIIYRLPPTTLTINLHLEDSRYTWENGYFLPHFHLPTYCVGLMVGFVLASKKTLQVRKKTSVILWISSTAVSFGVLFGVYAWNNGKEFPGLLPSVLYGSTHRFLWSLSLAWITISCHFEKKGIVSRFLGSENFVLLSRTSYMSYLTHMNVNFLYLGTMRHTITYDNKTILFLFFGIFVVTTIASTLLTLIFETPFMRIQKDFLRKVMDLETGKGK